MPVPTPRSTFPDKQSGARLILHADYIRLTDQAKPDIARAQMRGNVRYTLTQSTPLGERRVTGTAGMGDYRRASHKIVLSEGVLSELIDPRLDGPGTLRAEP